MRISDLKTTGEVSGHADIEHALMKRYDGVNQFWIGHDGGDYPMLAILANGDLAYLWYSPSEEHPGFHSVGSVPGLDPAGSTKFFFDEPGHEFSNGSVVSFVAAVQAAKDFSASAELPQSVEWFEL